MSDLIRPSSMESYIEDPNPNVESMSENFVGIDNVRKDNDAACRGGNGEGLVQGRTLPEELFRNVAVLSCESSAEGGRCDVYLVGTAHVSQESCRIVQSVISCLKPEVVFLEICSQRVAVLSPQNLKVPTFAEMVEMLKKKHNLFGILYSWFLAKVAYEEAMKYGGKVVLGDRPVQVASYMK
ncbi:hypothetical protein SAY86_016747 [Trapa natans]|uniref:TraB domain-containing protein n=1 Tax=Trapa natans TaxID=22666 RepID=A0AAN7M065_TRANT|nr:hypothetical protein SAY86_016747 [Trapa natans]